MKKYNQTYEGKRMQRVVFGRGLSVKVCNFVSFYFILL